MSQNNDTKPKEYLHLAISKKKLFLELTQSEI